MRELVGKKELASINTEVINNAHWITELWIKAGCVCGGVKGKLDDFRWRGGGTTAAADCPADSDDLRQKEDLFGRG